MTKKQKMAFIKKLATAVAKYAPEYGITCYSIPIAQGILESGWGESRLAKEYNNLFGLKCGTLWKGKSVNMETQEEFEPGTKTTISDNFRAYDSFGEGVKGYFEFLGLARYQNLKGITNPQEYAETIKKDGYATDSGYVISLMSLVEEWNLTQYDPAAASIKKATTAKEKETAGRENAAKGKNGSKAPVLNEGTHSADDLIGVMKSWLGFSEANGRHMEIIGIYNAHEPLARGYAVQNGDAWCATTVSAAAIKAGMTDIIPAECSCEEQIKLFQKLGCWEEDGSIVPEPGYIIYYNWDKASQPNDGWADHVGVVESVNASLIKVIEGNNGGRVAYRTIPVGWAYIRGYGKPRYGKKAAAPKSASTVTTSTTRTLCKEEQWVGRVTASALCVRSWAGLQYSQIRSWPILNKGNLVSICDSVKDSAGQNWWYVRIAEKYYGFVSAQYIERV